MSTPTRIAMQFPTRVAAGAFLLNSGWSKWNAGDEKVKQLHAMAAEAYPAFDNVEAGLFVQALSAGEMVLGSALLLPVVPEWLAGAALTGFSGGLLGLYSRLPGMRRPDSILPTDDGLALAKDSWLLAIGLSLLAGAVTKVPGKVAKKRRRRQRQEQRRQG